MITKFLHTRYLNRDKPTARWGNDDDVGKIFDSLPLKSIRSVETSSGKPKSSVDRIIKDNTNLYRYKQQWDHFIPQKSTD